DIAEEDKEEEIIIKEEDAVLVLKSKEELSKLFLLATLEPVKSTAERVFDTQETILCEAVPTPRSSLIGKSAKEVNFRQRFGFQVIALWREGKAIRSGLRDIKIRFGDAFLLYGSAADLEKIRESSDLLLVQAPQAEPALKKGQSWIVIAALFLMVILGSTNIMPAHTAAFLSALLCIASGCVSMEEGYRAIEWRIVALIALLLPFSHVVKGTVFFNWLSSFIYNETVYWGPLAAVMLLSVTASALSQALDSTLSVVILGPLAIETAHRLNIPPYPLVIAVSLGASLAFLTHFSHRVNLLVMGPGGYKPVDYFKLGFPLTVLSFLTMWGVLYLTYLV
ncbi:MAG: hypothetical protein D6780_07800, partial [Candidatus Dadabacteria bacterium]